MMSVRRRYLWIVAFSTFALATLPSIASSEPLPVEAVNEGGGVYGETHRWSNVPQTVAPGETVTFSNPTEVAHGVEWRSTLKATCEEGLGKVPVGNTAAASGKKWSGKCAFSQHGTYTFWCTVHGASMSGTITVTNGEPTVATDSATAETEHEATLKGTVNPNGKATEYFFKWGTTEAYGEKTSAKSIAAGTAGVPVSETLKGLATGTTYHFRLVAKNEKGTAEGADRTFTTASPPPPPGPPTATTGEATGVSETEATLKGTVNPDGEATKYVFRWGTTESYGQETSVQPAGSDHLGHPVSAVLKGLAPGTTYHFRLVAENNSGTVPGGDQVFTTTSPPLPPTTTTSTTTTTPPPTTTTTTPTPLVEPPPGPPITGGPSLHSTQRGTSVKGSLDVSQTGAGGRLEVDLTAKSASLARRGRSKQVTVGRLVRPSVSAGTVSFSVPLSARGKSALRRHHRLAPTVRITLTPTRGAAVTVVRGVVLRA